MGRYGINKHSDEEITEEDYITIISETTKIIEARQNTKEVIFAFYDRAWVYFKIHEYDRAISDCTSAIQIAPEFASAYFNRGLSQWKINQFEESLNDFNKALQFYLENNGTPEEIEETKLWIKKIKEKI